MTKGCGIARNVASPLATKRRNGGTKVSATHTKGPALVCEGVEEFLQPKARAYRGLLVKRAMGGPDIQRHVDRIVRSQAFGEDQAAHEEIDLCCTDDFARDLSKTAQRLAKRTAQAGLPKDITCRIEKDIMNIGSVLMELVPTAKQMLLKLEVLGADVCSRWHTDNYVGRAVCSYNESGTEFIHNDHVNIRQLENGGRNPGIVPDRAWVLNAGIGDILFMKGKVYPDTPNGLIHKSPEPRFRADGSVVNRLLLKVDLN